jgi:hypothetical protein
MTMKGQSGGGGNATPIASTSATSQATMSAAATEIAREMRSRADRLGNIAALALGFGVFSLIVGVLGIWWLTAGDLKYMTNTSRDGYTFAAPMASRVGALIVMLFLVRTLVAVARYLTKLASHYDATATTLALFIDAGTLTLNIQSNMIGEPLGSPCRRPRFPAKSAKPSSRKH